MIRRILCALVGHKPPVYAPKGWYSPGEQYGVVTRHEMDNIGRLHVVIASECPRCGKKFVLCRAHVHRKIFKEPTND